ncbi:MAG: sugar porter family MFS transporter [Ktedonobacteraceae bacterium]
MATTQHTVHDDVNPPGKGRPLAVYGIAAIAALGGLLFGYDTGVISGAELFLKKDFALTSFTEELAVSSILIGTIIGAFMGGRLSDAIGRKKTLMVMAIIFAVGAILTSLVPNLPLFIACRILVGFAVGVASFVAPMYIAEMAPPKLRGGLVTFNQLAITIGIAVSYWIDLAFASAKLGWRPMFAVAAIPGLALLVGMLFLSETPRWLAGRDRWDEADKALNYLSPSDKEQELKSIRTAVKSGSPPSLRTFIQSGLSLALVVGVGLALFQQFVGINTVIYYAPTIFGYAGFKSASGAILATSVVGVVNVIGTIIAIFLLDRVGRRPLLLIGSVGMAVSLAAMGIFFALGANHIGVLILISLLVYIISFAIGMGPVFWLLSSELFPTRLRGTGGSISTVANWGGNLLISITFLSLIDLIGKPFTFWLYALLAVGAFIFCWYLVPETNGKNLEKIEAYWKNGRKWE